MSRSLAQMRSTTAPFRRQSQVSTVARPLKTHFPAVLARRTLHPFNEFHTDKPGLPIINRFVGRSIRRSSLLTPPRRHPSNTTTTKMGSVPKDPAGFQIRKAVASDNEALAAMGAEVFTATFAHSCTKEQLQAFLNEAYTPEAIARDIADSSKDVLVATEEDDAASSSSSSSSSSSTTKSPGEGGSSTDSKRLLGFTYLTRGSSEPCVEHLERPVELQRLYIALGAHGRGLGKALSLAADEMARSQGFKTIWLGVWEENRKAQAFYRKMGFERIGEHVFDVGGDLQTDEIWWKNLR